MCTGTPGSWKRTKRERWRSCVAIAPRCTRLVERHDGRIVNTWGDAVIAEFASVVEAVQCAIETQQEISAEEAAAPQQAECGFASASIWET